MGQIVRIQKLSKLCNAFRRKEKRVVFTNGTFDILHRGHVEYLQAARKLGDILIVGLNTDASIRRIKGLGRPINKGADRSVVLSALGCVDFVCFFSDDTPLALIRAIGPDVLVKGADWKVNDIVGNEIVKRRGGRVRTIRLTRGRSTSNTIDRVLKAYCRRERLKKSTLPR
jgi:rfaE bifunctional protein nucleotidyltransferase chain/domain